MEKRRRLPQKQQKKKRPKRKLELSLLLVACFLMGCAKEEWKDDNVEKLNLPDAAQLNAVQILDDGPVLAFGGMKFERSDFFTSTDQGQSWQLFHHPPYGNKGVYASAAVGNRLWAAGFDGKLFFRNREDTAWTYTQTDFYLYTFSAIAYRKQTVLVAGNKSYNDGCLLRLDTLGNIQQVDSFPFAINGVLFVDEATSYAVGYGAVLKSTDTGKTWTQLAITDDNYTGIAAGSPDDVWVVGYEGTIVHIEDAGSRYKKIKNGQNPLGNMDRYRAIAFKDDFGVIVGDKGLVRLSYDGGANWKSKKPLTDKELRAVAIAPIGSYFITVGTFGAAFRVNF